MAGLDPALSNSGAPTPAHTAPCGSGTPLLPWASWCPPFLQQLLKGRSCTLHSEFLGPGAGACGLSPVASLWAGDSKKQTMGLTVSALRSEIRPGCRPPRTPEPEQPQGAARTRPHQACGRPPPAEGKCRWRAPCPQHQGAHGASRGGRPTLQEAGSLRNYPQQHQEAPSHASSGSKGIQLGGQQRGG